MYNLCVLMVEIHHDLVGYFVIIINSESLDYSLNQFSQKHQLFVLSIYTSILETIHIWII